MLIRRVRAFSPHSFIRAAAAAGLVLVVTLSFWRIQHVLPPAHFSLVSLLLTFVVAVWLGTTALLVAAFVTFFCFNFFLIKPDDTFMGADSRERLGLFPGRGVYHGAAAARIRVREQNSLYALSSAFNRPTEREGVYQTLQDILAENLPIVSCAVLPAQAAGTPAAAKTTVYVLIGTNEQVYGTLHVTFEAAPAEAQRRFLMACAVQAAMALQRIELAENVQRSRAIEEADRLKTTLLHAVSHDLRTPITVIKTAASNLLSLGEQISVAEKQEMTRTIEQEADNLDRLVGNLLDLSRLQAGALRLHEEWTAVSEIAGDVAAQAWQRRQTPRIRLAFPEDMPLVCCDYGLMLQALSNITDNVLRYEPADQQVEISGEFDEAEVRLRVVNHGPTIAPAEKSRIMEPFYRGSDGHVGLGLAISKGIVAAHNGRIWIEDTPGGGATFVIALPRSQTISEPHVDSRSR